MLFSTEVGFQADSVIIEEDGTTSIGEICVIILSISGGPGATVGDITGGGDLQVTLSTSQAGFSPLVGM